jgi:hypothetical protein
LVAEVLLARGGGEVGGGWSGHGGARRSRRRRGLGFPCSSLSLWNLGHRFSVLVFCGLVGSDFLRIYYLFIKRKRRSTGRRGHGVGLVKVRLDRITARSRYFSWDRTRKSLFGPKPPLVQVQIVATATYNSCQKKTVRSFFVNLHRQNDSTV